MARIFREATTIAPLTSMEDGDVAEVVEWHHPECIGSIIQRYKDIIIFIGKPSGNSYPTLFESGEFLKKCKVRILSPRSLIML